MAAEARLVTDDMAACLFSPTGAMTAGGFRSEQLELSADELGSNVARRFLEACAVDGEAAARAELEAAEVARRYGGAVLNVSFGTGEPQVEVVPSNVESIEASSRRSAAGRRQLVSPACATGIWGQAACACPRSASARG